MASSATTTFDLSGDRGTSTTTLTHTIIIIPAIHMDQNQSGDLEDKGSLVAKTLTFDSSLSGEGGAVVVTNAAVTGLTNHGVDQDVELVEHGNGAVAMMTETKAVAVMEEDQEEGRDLRQMGPGATTSMMMTLLLGPMIMAMAMMMSCMHEVDRSVDSLQDCDDVPKKGTSCQSAIDVCQRHSRL